MITRRTALTGAAALTLPRLGWTAEMGDDGLHKQPWFIDSFLELEDDLSTAQQEGRLLMLLFEQAGCPYCRELHQVNFKRTEIVEYLTAHFDVIQLDLWGAREVLNFDGTALEERALAARWAVNFTPTTMIFGRSDSGAATELFRLPGYLKPFHFLSSLEYVAEGHYTKQPFQRFLQDKFADLRAQGIDPDVW